MIHLCQFLYAFISASDAFYQPLKLRSNPFYEPSINYSELILLFIYNPSYFYNLDYIHRLFIFHLHHLQLHSLLRIHFPVHFQVSTCFRIPSISSFVELLEDLVDIFLGYFIKAFADFQWHF